MTKNKSKVNKNLYLMKLLVSVEEFQAEVAQIRKNANIHDDGFLNNEEVQEWYRKLEKNSDSFWKKGCPVSELPINKFHDSIEALVGKCNLPYNFLNAVTAYVLRNKIISLYLPSSCYAIAFSPKKGRAKWIDLRVYSRLTEKEIREAIKDLRMSQKHYLSSNLTKDIRVHKNTDLAIKIEAEMKKRIRKTEEKPDWYLKQVRRQYGEAEYGKVKRLSPKRLGKNVIKYTSKEIAEKFFGSEAKSNLVRQIYFRNKKEKKKLFEI